MLHIVKSPEKLPLVSRYIQADDVLLLVENAIYAASEKSPYFAHIGTLNRVFALEEDLLARGWVKKVSASIQVVNQYDFVDLTVSHSKSISW